MDTPNTNGSGSGKDFVWTVLLSSAVVLAVATGALYFLGGAYFEGISEVLGLTYLAKPQSDSYIFAVAELLLATSWEPFLIVSVAISAGALSIVEIIERKRFQLSRRSQEIMIPVTIIFLTFVVLYFFFGTMDKRYLLENCSCPIQAPQHYVQPILLLLSIALLTIGGAYCIANRTLKAFFAAWGISMVVLCIYNVGWDSGISILNTPRQQLAEVVSSSLLNGAETKVLVLGADDKSIVVLSPNQHSAAHPEPIYLSRSDLKSFHLTGYSSIDAFFCKPLNSPPKRKGQ